MFKCTLHTHIHVHTYLFCSKNDTTHTKDKSNEQTSMEQDARGSGNAFLPPSSKKNQQIDKHNENSFKSAS